MVILLCPVQISPLQREHFAATAPLASATSTSMKVQSPRQASRSFPISSGVRLRASFSRTMQLQPEAWDLRDQFQPESLVQRDIEQTGDVRTVWPKCALCACPCFQQSVKPDSSCVCLSFGQRVV